MPLDKMMIACLEGLLSMDSALSAGFLYLYCLGLDKPYFSELLCRFIGLNISHTLFDFFQQHYLRKWPVSRYARELGISSHKLNALFSERYGLPAKKWLTQQRLKKGCELLLTTTMPVAEIARRCGFSHHAHFSAIFRRHFKTNPSAFRERARHSWLLLVKFAPNSAGRDVNSRLPVINIQPGFNQRSVSDYFFAATDMKYLTPALIKRIICGVVSLAQLVEQLTLNQLVVGSALHDPPLPSLHTSSEVNNLLKINNF